MFGKQFSLIAQEEEALKKLFVFIIQVHVEACFAAGKTIEAPHWNLAFKSLLQLSYKAFPIPHLERCLTIYGICWKS